MPLIDLPLEQLQTYSGRNPRPSDFDRFWDDALDQLHEIPPEPAIELIKNPTESIITEAVFFRGIHGAEIYAKRARPRNAGGPLPTILQFHGYTMRSADWWSLYSWVAAGFQVLAMDCRGQGGKSQDSASYIGHTHRGHIVRGLEGPPDGLYFRSVFLDTRQLSEVALSFPETDPDRLFATGASQGGGLALACAALQPKVIKAASIYPFLCDYLRVWEMDLAKDAYQEIRDWLRLFDARHENLQQHFTKLGYIDVQHLAPRIQARTLMITGLMDTITPPSTQFAAYNKIRAQKEILVYPDFGHEGVPDANDLILEFFLRN